ncbi:LRR receptor-like serine/threonine-protein kinase EFR [Quercus lobata]|uniref:LRR receptor-like serine/threonine-protein kinase EFR n=1 Tax=Quercus lobata TaxID=97700 RepID=UPI001245D18F|nr:LRR receptor-like serine/threonine-protein kinase EFR [Quercus lobata]
MGLSQWSSSPPSSSFFMHAFILLWWCGLLVTSVVGGNNETDRLALLEFKAKIIDDPLQVLSSWNDSIHFCQWRGVTCGRRHQRVIVLDLRTSKLIGSISPHVGNLSSLKNLILSNNSFHNEIPSEIDRLRRLQFLLMSNNTYIGKIPRNLSHCTNLKIIDFGRNLLDGEIPTTLGTLSKLRLINFDFNDLTGSIPPSFGNLSSLKVFGTAYNNLGGSVPTSFGQLMKLTFFGVGVNRLSRRIPPSIFNLSSLKVFVVGLNQIQGHLPSDIGITLPNIEKISISSNQFTGPIPISISKASNIKLLELDENKLRGRVPSLEKLYRVSMFVIAFNELGNGGANDLIFLCSLTNSTYLTYLVINMNNFGGELPKCIVNFSTTLTFLYLDNNKISGNIPLGIGNLINLEDLRMWNNKLSGNIPSEIGKLRKLQIFGSVYRGIFDQDCCKVAIKVLNLLHHGASKSFIAKCEALRNIRHRNLVKVLIACSGVDYQGHDFKALVYEFMTNDNLDGWLHLVSRRNEVPKKKNDLNLLQRLNIAINIAHALEYLHHHCHTPIVHCDLKPSNVLLNDEMIGHVGDFGLARFLQEATQECFTNQSSSIGLRGTIGYATPEYGMGNEVSIYGDVYSYGILLLEMFIGKRPTDNIFKDNLNLHDFVTRAMPEQVQRANDPIGSCHNDLMRF